MKNDITAAKEIYARILKAREIILGVALILIIKSVCIETREIWIAELNFYMCSAVKYLHYVVAELYANVVIVGNVRFLTFYATVILHYHQVKEYNVSSDIALCAILMDITVATT